MCCHVTPNKFACGGVNVIFEVVFEDGTIWLCRVGYVGKEYSSAFIEAMMQATVATMHYVSLKSAIRVPKVYSYQATMSDNEIGAAYMFIEPIHGMSEMDMLSRESFEVDIKQIDANVAWLMYESSKLVFPTIGWLYETPDGYQIGPIVDYTGQKHGPFQRVGCWRAMDLTRQGDHHQQRERRGAAGED